MTASERNGFSDFWVRTILESAKTCETGVPVLAIGGLQGSGKSTLAAQVVTAARSLGQQATALSIDDFYLTHAQRLELARTMHPLLATRGPPGTHDLPLMRDILDSIRAGGCPRLPVFDKLGDDRLPSSQWTRLERPLDLLVFEGWFLKTPAQTEAGLHAPINELERQEDGDGRWRRWCNDALARDYPAIWARLDMLWFLQPPGFDVVAGWRWQQEQTLRTVTNRPGMNEAQVRRFVQFFERVSRQSLRELPAIAEHTLRLDSQRRIERHSPRPG